MGVLSKAAEKTFRKSARQAYVPEWWRAAAFGVGGLVLAGVVVSGIIQGTPAPAPATAGGVEAGGVLPAGSVTNGMGTGTTVASTGTEVGTGQPSTAPSSAVAPVEEMVTVSQVGGGSTQVSKPAMLLAQKAARALFSGSFAQVPLRSGSVTPYVIQTWKSPQVGNVKAVAMLPDGSIVAAFPVDPDGATGAEPARDVNVTVALENGGWVFVPAS